MGKIILHSLFITTLALLSTSAWAYNQELAASYRQLFEPVSGAKAGKALHLVKPEAFIEELKRGKNVVVIDVRTAAESNVFSMTLPGSLRIPASDVFKPENLARLPKDRQMVIVCKSGTRATAIGTALRHVGFNNTYILKGGIKALNAYLDPKTANTPAQKGKPSMK